MARLRRIPQPPIDRAGRPSESRRPWGGLALTLVGLVLLLTGLLAAHTIPGTNVVDWPQWRLVGARTHRTDDRIRAEPVPSAQAAATEPLGHPPAQEPAEAEPVEEETFSDDYCPT